MKIAFVQPTFHRVLVEPIDDLDRPEGSVIIIPEKAKERPTRGTVMRVGWGRVLNNGAVQAMRIRVGQVVVFDAWSAKEITIDGKKTYLLPEDDCLATLEPAPVIEKPAGFEAAHSVQNVP